MRAGNMKVIFSTADKKMKEEGRIRGSEGGQQIEALSSRITRVHANTIDSNPLKIACSELLQ